MLVTAFLVRDPASSVRLGVFDPVAMQLVQRPATGASRIHVHAVIEHHLDGLIYWRIRSQGTSTAARHHER